MTSATDRLHYMDNLRALAMLLGIFFHAALAYSPMMTNLWLSAGPEESVILENVAWFTHLFRMPLFFLIAGFFAVLLLSKRGEKGFIVHRLKRIGLPFIIFTPLVIISVFISLNWALNNVENLSPMLGAIQWMMANPELAPEAPESTMHMWFLYYLLQFCLVGALIHKLGLLEGWLTKLVSNRWVIVLVYPLLLVPAFATQQIPHPAPEKYIPQLWGYGIYGLFFLLGMVIYKRQEVLDELRPLGLPLLVISIGLYWLILPHFPGVVSFEDIAKFTQGVEFSTEHLGLAILEAYTAVFMTIVCLVYGARLLNKQNVIFRYTADASYWIYIIHIPVLFVLQYHLLDVEWGVWTEYLVSSFGALAIGFISYAVLVRWTPIGLLLNGMRVPLGKTS